MKRRLAAYRIKLEVIGPVHVGSGKMFNKKEYFFISKDKIGILDTVKLYCLVKKLGLQSEFESYVINNSRIDLAEWLEKYNIDKEKILPCVSYTLGCKDTALQRGTKITVCEQIKDSYGKAYIPGSTIKGMLRTVLLSYDVMKSSGKYDEYKDKLFSASNIYEKRNKFLLREINSIEEKAFYTLNRKETRHNDAVNDFMSGVIVSDSNPIDIGNIVMCQKLERHAGGAYKSLNVLRECICPGTEIEFSLTIDETVCSVTIEDIYRALKVFNRCYNDCFLSAYTEVDMLDDNNIFIGGGTGFVSKTVIYPMLGKSKGIEMSVNVFKKTKVPKEHKHYKDFEYGVSPHILKCTKYNGQVLQMGLCKVSSVEKIS